MISASAVRPVVQSTTIACVLRQRAANTLEVAGDLRCGSRRVYRVIIVAGGKAETIVKSSGS